MSVHEIVVEEDKKRGIAHSQDKEIVRFRGKEIKKSKLQKKLRHKPRLISPVLINLSIILAIIIFILIFF